MKKLAEIIIAAIMCMAVLTGCNKQIGDFTYKFDYAQILMPDGSVVEGKVESWKDFEDGDQIQVKINGKQYLTDTTRCVLWKE